MTGYFHLFALLVSLVLPLSLSLATHSTRRRRGENVSEVTKNYFPNAAKLPQVQLVIEKYGSSSGLKLYDQLNFVLFVLVTCIGFEVLLCPVVRALAQTNCRDCVALLVGAPSVMGPGPRTLEILTDANTPTLGAIQVALAAFLGGYIAAGRNLLRQAMNFELNGVSFARSVFWMLMSVVVATITFLSVDLVTAGWARSAAIGIAFLIGLSPEAGLAFLSRQINVTLTKNIETGVYRRAKIIPIEVIDGIDPTIAFRLEENNIEDVQNLATANPIQVYVETPYGLFEIFDWVLQAQLCLVVGANAFFDLKLAGIRTIFDLERAVLGDGADDRYVLAIGRTLLGRQDSPLQALLAGPDLDADPARAAKIVQHAVALTMDDVHIDRLRLLWRELERSSWGGNARSWLYRQAPLPADPPAAPPAA